MYEIYSQKTGQHIGIINSNGQICCGNPVDQHKLEAFFQREIMLRETETGETEAVLEETMCFLCCQTLSPGSAEYLETALELLPILTNYNWIATSTTS